MCGVGALLPDVSPAGGQVHPQAAVDGAVCRTGIGQAILGTFTPVNWSIFLASNHSNQHLMSQPCTNQVVVGLQVYTLRQGHCWVHNCSPELASVRVFALHLTDILVKGVGGDDVSFSNYTVSNSHSIAGVVVSTAPKYGQTFSLDNSSAEIRHYTTLTTILGEKIKHTWLGRGKEKPGSVKWPSLFEAAECIAETNWNTRLISSYCQITCSLNTFLAYKL